MYRRIDGDKFRLIYACGDLHGCYDLFQSELKAIDFDPNQDLMLSVGDLVDRGAQNLQCLALINEPWFESVKGNHEELMYNALLGDDGDADYWWHINGGSWDAGLFHEEKHQLMGLARQVPDLPLVIHLQLGRRTVVVAHADYPLDRYEFGLPVDPQMVIWNRLRIQKIQCGMSCGIVGADLFIFGHTILPGPLPHENLLYIDTGAVRSGILTIAKVK